MHVVLWKDWIVASGIHMNELTAQRDKCRVVLEKIVATTMKPGMEDPFNDGWKWHYAASDALGGDK